MLAVPGLIPAGFKGLCRGAKVLEPFQIKLLHQLRHTIGRKVAYI